MNVVSLEHTSVRSNDKPREFTPGEKALIRRVHGFMPAGQLLRLLNERLVCDLGADANPHTTEQLYAEIGGVDAAVPNDGHDWASLRKLLAKARQDGVLEAITEPIIVAFAVVYSLNPRQLVALKDIILQAKEDDA